MKQYKYLLFDCDDTLLDFKKAERTAFFEMTEAVGVDGTDELYSRYHTINASLWRKIETGDITLDELRTRRYFELVGDMPLAERMAKVYEDRLAECGESIVGSAEVLGELKKHYKLYAVTNGIPKAQRNRMAKAGLDGYMDGMFISGEIGYAKPDRRFFEYAVETVGDSDKSRYLIIGDTLSSDIKGAENVGIDSVWYNPNGLTADGTKPTYTVNRLDELYAILDL